MGEGSSKQCLHKTVNVSWFVRESERKKLTANAALTVYILSETTRDESTLTYADNGI